MLTWDRSHNWSVQRFFNELVRVTIRFKQNKPSVYEMLALRKCLPQYRDVSPTDLRASITETDEIVLDEMPTGEARTLVERMKAEGLIIATENASFVSFVPFDRTTGHAWLIDDENEARAIAESMIAAGIPVVNVQA